MKSIGRVLLLSLLIISFVFGGWITTPAFGAATVPNRLDIARSPGINAGSSSSHEIVLSAGLVQKLYQYTLSLPTAPANQLCPMYLIASYQLTFFHGSTKVLRANAVNGQCQPVALNQGDVRTADSTFWKLLDQAQTVGVTLNAGTGSLVPAVKK